MVLLAVPFPFHRCAVVCRRCKFKNGKRASAAWRGGRASGPQRPVQAGDRSLTAWLNSPPARSAGSGGSCVMRGLNRKGQQLLDLGSRSAWVWAGVWPLAATGWQKTVSWGYRAQCRELESGVSEWYPGEPRSHRSREIYLIARGHRLLCDVRHPAIASAGWV